MPKDKKEINKNSVQPVTGITDSEKIVILLETEDLVRDIFRKSVDRMKLASKQWGFAVYSCTKNKSRFTAVFCPAGAPNIDIAVNELAKAGGRIFVKAGCCGGINKKLKVGDLIILKSALKHESVSKAYERYPQPEAFASDIIINSLVGAARKCKQKYVLGKSITVDSLYAFNRVKKGNKLIPMTFRSYRTWQEELLNKAKTSDITCVEMESASLFTLCNLFGLKSGVLVSVSDRVPWESDLPFDFAKAHQNLFRIVVSAIEILSENRNLYEQD